MNKINSLLLTDGYKLGHHLQYPEGTTLVFDNFTPRNDKYAPSYCKGKGVVVAGIQYTLMFLKEHFESNFFKIDKEIAVGMLQKELNLYLNCEYGVDHFEALHDLGYLPIEIRSLDEGSICPIGVPMLTIHNTKEEFFWVPNYLETILSLLLWKPMTSATIAKAYREILISQAMETDPNNLAFVDFQGHDFSMRGLDSIDTAMSSGLGHLFSFSGTESLPTLYAARKYYNAEGFIAGTVPATEHSVMCAGGEDDELETYSRLMTIYPNGLLSVVSDTWDLWNVLTNILPQLKEQIMSRDGKLVIRPDSGDPVDIICGHELSAKGYTWADDICESESEFKGVIELLWDIFGGTVNEQGFKVLDSHVGVIYGDSITPERAQQICERLKAKGFATTNVVLGIGSYTYQYNTRDTFGFAMKATYVESKVLTVGESGNVVEEIVGKPIFKDPITDDGIKKSAKGLLSVHQIKGSHGISKPTLKQDSTWDDVVSEDNLLKVRFVDGEFYNMTTLEEIRKRLQNETY